MGELSRLAYETAARDQVWPVLPVVVADADTGEIIYISHSCSTIFGYSTNELIGIPIEILVPDEVKDVHSKWRRDVGSPTNRMLGAGRQVKGKKKDGTIFPAHVSFTAMVAGNRQIVAALVVDLTTILLPVTKPQGPTVLPQDSATVDNAAP